MPSLFPRFIDAERQPRRRAARPRARPRPPPDGLFRALRGGMGELVSAIGRRLPAGSRPPATPAAGSWRQAPGWRVRREAASASTAERHPRRPAHAARDLLRPRRSRGRDVCGTVPYVSTASVALAWPRRCQRTRSRAAASSSPAGTTTLRITACTWVSSKWDGARTRRAGAAAGVHRRRARSARRGPRRRRADRRSRFATSRRSSAFPARRSSPRVVPLARRRRAAHVGHRGADGGARRRGCAQLPGLFVAGSGFESIGIPDCVPNGRARGRRRRLRYDGTVIRCKDASMIDSVVVVADDRGSSLVPAAHAQAQPAPDPVSDPAPSKLLAEIKGRTRDSSRSPRRTGGSCACMVASSGAKRALEIGGASGYSAIWIGMGLRATGGRLVTIEYDPRARRSSPRTSSGPGLSDIVQVVSRRRVRADPEAPRHVRLRVPGCLEEGLQAVLRHGLSAARQGRALSRAQRRQQAQRDGRLSRRDSEESVALDDDRVAVRRRDVGVAEA